MSSIPNAAMPRAVAKAAQETAPKTSERAKLLFGLAITPPVVAIALSAFAFKRLRALASDIARKVDANGHSEAPAVTVDPVEVEKGGALPLPV